MMKVDSPSVLYSLAQAAFAAGSFKTAVMHTAMLADKLKSEDLRTRRSTVVDVATSIIVVTYRHSDHVLNMLEHLAGYTKNPDFELIVVDNGNAHLSMLIDQMQIDCTVIEPSFNYGCSGGRNLGAHYARGDVLVFIDDDGELEPGTIEALCSCLRENDAVAVRGRVVPLTDPKLTGGHYDKGSRVIPAVPDAEGISAWKREPFIHFGGFDVLLYGHEGIRLMAKMYPYYGPRHFLYCPTAVLRHDFHSNPDHAADKEARYKSNRDYLDHLNVKWRELSRAMRDFAASREIRAAAHATKSYYAHRYFDDSTPLSILTTSWNGRTFLDEYSASLKEQTHQNFEVIFVDDGSDDGSTDRLEELWRGDSRLHLIRTDHEGRSAALNTAVAHAQHDICVIADIDDISVRRRLEWTCRYFSDHPDSSCMSFYCFNEETSFRLARPYPSEETSIKARMLTGMPVSFPTFAFRKSLLTSTFNVELDAGVDCDWLYRAMRHCPHDGHLIPLPGTYYRIHDNQITSSKRDKQQAQALQCLATLHSEILQSEVNPTSTTLAHLSAWAPIESGSELNPLLEYIDQLMMGLNTQPNTVARDTRRHLMDAFLDLQERRMRGDYTKVKAAFEKARTTPATPAPLKMASVSASTKSTNYGPLGVRRLFLPIGLAAVAALGPKRDRERFRNNPAAFYDSLPVKWQRKVGLFFFPYAKESR
ncbi:glycosyltransferase [Leptospira interrogans]